MDSLAEDYDASVVVVAAAGVGAVAAQQSEIGSALPLIACARVDRIPG
jgi:hypothetical protein